MQTVRNGHFAEIEEFNTAEMKKKLSQHDVDHVEVFPATKENMKSRTEKIGKKYSPSTGFKKAPTNKKNR